MAEGAGALVGRRRELKCIDELLDRLDSEGRGFHLQVVGELGIGKTSFLEEICERAERRHHLVLRGLGTEFEGNAPFRCVLDALDGHVAAIDPEAFSEVAGWYSELLTATPASPVQAGTDPLLISRQRQRTYGAVQAMLAHLARSRPLVLALDDIHWADPASVGLLSHMLARPPQRAVGLVLAGRARRYQAPGPHLLSGRPAHHPAEVLQLSPLTRKEADRIIAGAVPRSAADELYTQSGGNPFYLQQLLREPRRRRDVEADDRKDSVPTVVVAAIRRELAALAPDARRFLQAGAVLGDPFDDGLAAVVGGIEPTAAFAIIDSLVDQDLIRTTSVPRSFAFRHPIVRKAVYEATGAGWRIGAHARAASALRARGASAPAIAHHAERSGTVGDAQAIAVLVEAGRESLPRAPDSAAHWFDAALRLMPEQDPARVEIQLARATALGVAGRLDDSYAALSAALERSAASPEGWPADALAFYATVERLVGRHRQAQARLLQALANHSDHGSREAAFLKVELSAGACFVNDFASSRRWAAEAAQIGRSHGDPLLQAAGEALVAFVDYSVGATADALRRLRLVTILLDSADDMSLSRQLAAACFVIRTEVALERLDDALRHCERTLAVTRSGGQGQHLVPAIDAYVSALGRRGRLAEAGKLITTALDASRMAGHGQPLASALFLQSWVSTLTGDLKLALRAGLEAFHLAKSFEQSVLKAGPHTFFAQALVEVGRFGEARSELLAVGGGPELVCFGRVCRTSAYEILAHADLALGDVRAANEWAERAESATDRFSLPLESAAARRARAAVLLASGDAAAAIEPALSGAEEASRAGGPVEAGRCRLLGARALACAGRRKEALVELDKAEAEMASSGARRYRQQAVAEKRRLGSAADNGVPQDGAVSLLTKRERDIAELVTLGKTNREIAAACYISAKTVERHLSSIFAKLGTRSRTGVARVLTVTAWSGLATSANLTSGGPSRGVAEERT